MQWLVIAALGFTIYGPQMLIGLCGAELISPKSVGASQGILGLISYMGAAGAGIPLSYLQVRPAMRALRGRGEVVLGFRFYNLFGGGHQTDFQWAATTTACRLMYVGVLLLSLLLTLLLLSQVHYGWNGYFTAMIGACVISLALMLPLANAKSYVQTQQDSKQAA